MWRSGLWATVLLFFAPNLARAATCDAQSPIAWTALPRVDLFVDPLADVKAPRFLLAIGRTSFRRPSVVARQMGAVGVSLANAGGTAALLGYRGSAGCDGIQLEIFGLVASAFNVSTPAVLLLAADYIAGPQITGRYGPWSMRLRGLHQSSHLGDELMLEEPNIARQALSFEALDAVLAYEMKFARIYAGGGAVVFSDIPVERPIVHVGAETFGAPYQGWVQISPLGGAYFRRQQGANSWAIKAGGELASPSVSLRWLVTFAAGAFPYAQFFAEESGTAWGTELQIIL